MKKWIAYMLAAAMLMLMAACSALAEPEEIIPQSGHYYLQKDNGELKSSVGMSLDFDKMEFIAPEGSAMSSYIHGGRMERELNMIVATERNNLKKHYTFEIISPTQIRFVAEKSATLTIKGYTLKDQDVLTLNPLK